MADELAADIKSVILTEGQIRGIVQRMGAEISRDYEGRNPLIVAVLRGAFVFTADLLRSITIPCEVDFMAVSSYGDGVKSSGVVRIIKDLSTKVEGRDLIIAEDILDSGLTLSYLVELLKGRGPKSVSVAAFSIKDIPNHAPAINPEYVGAHVPNEFIVGYGLDYAEKYRNLPYVGVLKPEVYQG
ncbi:hypoxanthine phosphoribosyltransferase [uncultured Olsenella sp.]|uniref:hypoxanthine phosphoribosyltransferase n=1 Tax=uncultured Olsenella sp. TaxID=190764 RepID=UPI0026DD5CCB|nr:hypoxanthine phosphoribosyltransferase [uncultured Olsenella sp.]